MLENGYGIMPNKVLFDKEITSTSKLIFVLLSSLCAQEGYSWVSNAYLGDKLGLSERQVSRSIAQLKKYISITNPYDERRRITLDKNVYAVRQKRPRTLDKNVQHNSIKNTTSIKGNLERYKTREQMNMPDLYNRNN